MPSKKILLQGVTKDNHITAVKQVLSVPNLDTVLICAAFVSEGGILLLEDSLVPVADKTTIFAGIRNGLTSAQGLSKCISIGCKTYAVDTGSRTVIFHPKIYISKSTNEARILIGSANLTPGGLNYNIEASIYMELDLADRDSSALIEQLENKITSMTDNYPDHVFIVTDEEMIQHLVEAGRIVDESLVPAPVPTGSSRNRDLDNVPRMRLKTKLIAQPRATRLPTRSRTAPATPLAPAPSGVAAQARERLNLVWESTPLVRRDLTIPTGANTNPTGSMLFKKGNSNIDQQTYFRIEVFNHLAWRPDPRTVGKELAEANFQIIIRSVDFGVYRLTVTHDTRTNTRSYKQHQPMSALRWGAARQLIARDDLLDRTMRLYRDNMNTDSFVIEID